ncbi:tail fiber domain-containing protein [Cronobacter dublinensis]|nr:tail fiber domain-containing protein [Cronobacter dublinensis]ELY3972517.1 tail fiber domain-containing protein [Cronobacter dublinensis]ELY4484076.1 tail fiber domain-containing protein [Cronobacter dublinensis]ELY5825571.1 tail fiber domain-containing protein [Cronobacter dublinensis]
MSAGTITLTHKSDSVSGVGTKFTDLVPGDFIVSTVGGITYTLPVSTITSDTQATLIRKYEGSTQSGLAWQTVPRATQNQVTAELVAQATQALRVLNNDKINWQQVFSAGGNITVTLPDGSSFTGPSWFYLANQLGLINTYLDGKANSTDVLTKADNLASVASKSTARTNLGLGGAAVLNVGNTANTVAAGDDARLNSVDGKNAGVINGVTTVQSANGVNSLPLLCNKNIKISTTYFGGGLAFGWTPGANFLGDIADMYVQFDGNIKSVFHRHILPNGVTQGVFAWHSNGNYNAFNGTFVSGSDRRIKYDIEEISNPREKVRKIRGVTYKLKVNDSFGIGFIAQEVEEVFPGAVTTAGYNQPMPDGSVVENVKSIDAGSIGAGLHHAALNELYDCDEEKEARIQNITAFLKTLGFDPEKDYTAKIDAQGS